LLLTFLSEHEGNLSQALDIAENLAKTSPAFSEARLRYADLLLKAGLPEKAAEEAKAAISISVGSETKAYVILAFALHKMGNLDECSKVVNYALPRFPSQTGLLLLNGYLSEYSREFDKAQESYKKILVLKPEDISANNALATLGEKTPPVAGTQASAISIMSLKDQAKEAAKIIMPLIEEYPENLPLREALGKIYLKARFMKEARSQFAEIYAQDFDYPNIKKLLEEASEELPKFIPPPKAEPYKNSKNLADSLAKTFAALRENERHNNDYDELGRYFVPYEAPLKDFFSRYSVTRFQKQDERTFSERYEIGSFFYENTIFFDPKKEFYATRVIISDTTKPNSPDYVPDFYRLFLKKATGIMGEGIAAGATVCNGYEWEGYIWASRSSFEILMHSPKQGRKVFFIRLHARRFLDTGNLCHYVNMATGRSKIPR
jgi:tetratricopeptide (TPR) repeat protein